MESTSKKSDYVKRFLNIFFKYKLTLIIVIATTLITTVFGTMLLTPIYEAESAIMVNFGREYVYMPEVGEKTPYNYYNRTGVINTEIEILNSKDLHEKVVETIGINNIYPEITEKQQHNNFSLSKLINFGKNNQSTANNNSENLPLNLATEKFEYFLSIRGNSQSNVIKVEFQHHDPNIAAKALNLLIEFFQEKHLEAFRDPKIYRFLEKMVADYKVKLDISEANLERFRKDNSVFSFEEQKEILLNQRGDFDQLLKETESEVVASRERLKSLNLQFKKMSKSTALFSETSERADVIDNAKSKLLDLQLKEQELLSVYSELSPKVKNIRNQIKVVEDFLNDQKNTHLAIVRRGKDNAYQEVETDINLTKAELQGLTAKSKVLESKIKEIDKSLQQYAITEKEMRSLELERTVNEDNYRIYLEKFEEAKVNNEMDKQVLTNIRIVSKATPPQKPYKPNMELNLLFGISLGIAGGLALIFTKDYLHQGLNSAEDVEHRLGLPVLATVRRK